jgi:hypothetical protein
MCGGPGTGSGLGPSTSAGTALSAVKGLFFAVLKSAAALGF